MWGVLETLAWFIGLAILFNGWPSFVTHNHYHVNKKDDEK